VLDLVNTLDNRFRADGPTELLPDYAALLRFMEQTQLLDATQALALAGAPLRPRRSDRSIPPASCAKQPPAPSMQPLRVPLHGQPMSASWCDIFRAARRPGARLVPSRRDEIFLDWGAHSPMPICRSDTFAAGIRDADVRGISRLRTCGCETLPLALLVRAKSHTPLVRHESLRNR